MKIKETSDRSIRSSLTQETILRCHYLFLAILTFVVVTPVLAAAQTQIPIDLREKIDNLIQDSLARTGVPCASVALVKDGQVAYVKAYGDARIDPRTPATPEMRYSIGSISKQFTAAAILLLQEEGKLSLDDKVGKFVPGLTRGNEVTIRQLLSHTSGYQDYWPQDYLFPMMLEPVRAERILDLWAHQTLDFEPGTKWQYSNTNYVIAGLIVEQVSGRSLFQFLREKAFVPLRMGSVMNIDSDEFWRTGPVGYMRYALGPLHTAPKAGKGWLFSAGDLVMTARDLASWDVSIIDQKLMKPSSYRELESEVLLKNGLGTRYGLGINVGRESGHRALSHGGEISGFSASNVIFPDDRIAVAVLTNQDGAGAAGQIAYGIAHLFLGARNDSADGELHRARRIFEGLQHGTIDRSLFTSNGNSYFSEVALKDFASGLGPLGAPEEFSQTYQVRRGGMTSRGYQVKFKQRTLQVSTYETLSGKLEEYHITAQQ